MLGLIGLLSALMAGLALDLSASEKDESTPEDDLADPPEEEVWQVSTAFLDDSAEENGQPTSDDTPDPVDADETLQGGGGDDILSGHGGNDLISGGSGGDLIDGRDGADRLQGDAGEDHMHGHGGADSLTGGDDNDVLWGEGDDDALWGEAGDDSLFGAEGDDTLDGGFGDDSLTGGIGADTVEGGAGDDMVSGGDGADLIGGGAGRDEVEGGTGADTLWGAMPGEEDVEVDFLNGGSGDDLLLLGAGDYANGGEGSDAFALQDIQPGDPLVQITDFNPAQDELVVLYDANIHPNPELTLHEVSGASILMLDGVPLASLTNGAVIDLATVQLRAA